MKQFVKFFIILAVTFYLAMIYRSRGMVFLGYTEIFVMLLLSVYNVIGMRSLRVGLDVPLGITEQGKRVPVKIKIQNYGSFPMGKACVQLVESYEFFGKKRKTSFYASPAGRRYYEDYGTTVIRTVWEPAYTGKVVISIKKVKCYDLLGALCLPLSKHMCGNPEVITVVPAIYQVPVDVGNTVENFAAEQERYLQYDSDETLAEQFQVRNYQPGDRLRSIHWKLSAKEGELMVKEYEPVKGCPVLFFLDVTGETEKRERKEEKRRRDSFFTVMASLSSSMIQNQCRHYVIWYDGKKQDVMRYRVEKEEDVYSLLSRINGIQTIPKGFDLEEGYYEKYHEKSYASKLMLDHNLRLTCNEEQVIHYRLSNLKESLAGQTVYL